MSYIGLKVKRIRDRREWATYKAWKKGYTFIVQDETDTSVMDENGFFHEKANVEIIDRPKAIETETTKT